MDLLIKRRLLWLLKDFKQDEENYALYGAGKVSRQILEVIKEYHYPLPVCILDDNPRETHLEAIPICKPEDSNQYKIQHIILGTDTFQDNCRGRINEVFLAPNKPTVADIFEPNAPNNYLTLKKQNLDQEMREYKAKGIGIVMFNICNVKQLQFTDPILEEFKQQKQPVACYLSCPDHISPKELQNSPSQDIPFVTAEVAEQLEETDIFVQTEIYGRGPESSERIFIAHGQPSKLTNWDDENLQAFNHYFLYGELEKSMFAVIQEGKPQQTSHIQMHEIGYPKLDDSINNNYDRNSTLGALNLDPTKQTVLYAPTWEEGGALRTHGTRIAEKLLELDDINVLVKLHPISTINPSYNQWEFYTGGVDWNAEFRQLEKHQNFRYITDDLINPLFTVADLLITDFSGVSLEFMVLNKPAIFVDCPEFYEKTLPGWGCDPELARYDDRFNAGRNYCAVVYGLDELQQVVTKELNDPDQELTAKREKFIHKFLYNPGRGSAATVEAIMDMLS